MSSVRMDIEQLFQSLNMRYEYAVEPLCNGHLGTKKWPLKRGGRCRDVLTRVNDVIETLERTLNQH